MLSNPVAVAVPCYSTNGKTKMAAMVPRVLIARTVLSLRGVSAAVVAATGCPLRHCKPRTTSLFAPRALWSVCVARQAVPLRSLRGLRTCSITSAVASATEVGQQHAGLQALSELESDFQDWDDEEIAAVSPKSAALSIALPTHCCGCGIRLQQLDVEAPGFFKVPSKLREAAQPAAGAADQPEEEGVVDAYEQARREMDREVEDTVAKKRQAGRAAAVVAPLREEELPEVFCERCFALRHSGKVKHEELEGMLPVFDLGKKVGRKIFLQKDRRAVVLCVVDISDFDGSLPRLALKALMPPNTPEDVVPEEKLNFKLMVAVNKFDLLPAQASEARVVQWVRQRLVQAALPPADKVFAVSAEKGFGVHAMVDAIKTSLGFRGDLWVVGAQNAGKSSLINAMKRIGGSAGRREPTVAPMPGTTLGLLRVPGLPFGAKHRTFDTPGVRHDYQLTSQLHYDDVKQVLPKRRFKGRTYRMGPGNTLLLGGLARLDILDSPSATLYLTVFVSNQVGLHMGKTATAEERQKQHAGTGLLTPPMTPERQAALPPLEAREITVEGQVLNCSTVDIAIAGLGWIAVGCRGEARLRLWTLPGVAVTRRNALIPDYAKDFERPGYSNLMPVRGGSGGSATTAGAHPTEPGGRARDSAGAHAGGGHSAHWEGGGGASLGSGAGDEVGAYSRKAGAGRGGSGGRGYHSGNPGAGRRGDSRGRVRAG